MTIVDAEDFASHNAFFERIISLIPPELYGASANNRKRITGSSSSSSSSSSSGGKGGNLPLKDDESVENNDESGENSDDDEEEEEEVNSRYFKHMKQPLTANERKIVSKRTREEKYKSLASTAGGREMIDGQMTQHTADMDNIASGGEKEDSSASKHALDSLRERLQRKINDLRTSRTSQKQHMTSQMMNERKKKELEKQKQNDHKSKKNHKKSAASNDDIRTAILHDDNDDVSVSGSIDSSGSSTINRKRKYVNEDGDDDEGGHQVEDVGDVDYGGIDLKGQPSKSGDSDVGKPGSKARRLKRMLQEAEKKKQRLEELKQQGKYLSFYHLYCSVVTSFFIHHYNPGDSGIKRAHAEHWNDIMKGVSGEKVLEDTKKIRKALKRKEKEKSKSADAWKERLDKVQEQKNSKQDKREKNLAIRAGKTPKNDDPDDDTSASGGKKKRNRLNEHRAKTLGAGFEGKKTTFLNSKSSSGDN